ncbi:MAG: OmpA family protein [Bacteroidota bacterium]|nr:OmpA family protein [Bacteroidota bacterium]
MIKYLLLKVLFLLTIIQIYAQTNCVFNKDEHCIAKGKLKTIKVKSSYGTKYTNQIRVGKWQFFNEEGLLVAEGSYIEKDNASYKQGEWLYYNQDNLIIIKREFNLDKIVKTQYLDTGTYIYQTDTIHVINDDKGGYKVKESKGNIKITYTSVQNKVIEGTPLVKSNVTNAYREMPIYDSVSDSVLIQTYSNINNLLNVEPWQVDNHLNLIQNGDFELMRDKMKPNHVTSIKPMNDDFAKFWGSANETPDIFKSFNNCFVGFRVFGVNYEVLRNELKQPLIAGKDYCFQFKIKLKKENQFAINGVSMIASPALLNFQNNRDGLKNGITLQTHPKIVLALREQWMIVSGSFKAIGGEKYIYMGNFTDENLMRVIKIDSFASNFANEIYYYIDDVVLIESNEDYLCPCNTSNCILDSSQIAQVSISNTVSSFDKPQKGQVFVLRNIQFETSKSELLPSSYDVLDSLFLMMLNYPNMLVEVSGHTDNRGTNENNLTLSKDRANAVVVYLMDKGIDEYRFKTMGYGSSVPTDNNETEEGRLNNRRVEFKVLEM